VEFDFINTPLEGLTLIQRKMNEDNRGFFSRFFCSEEYAALGLTENIVQINHTKTIRGGTVRGLHFQRPPHSEIKIVSCVRGEVFDVVVDIRKGSKTFLQWHGETLSEDNYRSLFIPRGFAHGFQALGNDCELIYLHSAPYQQSSEGALNVSDPRLSISWPLSIVDLSERDSSHSFISDDFEGLET
jgi:dTDP-4-dehydrorhamnose 3,5-epimerase